MNPVLLYLENCGIFNPEQVRNFILRSSKTKLIEFQERLKALVIEEQDFVLSEPRDPLSFYNFMASEHLRGDCCRSVSCRRSKVQLLARYSCLYADQVLVPVWLNDSDEDDYFEEILAGTLLSILDMRPAIEAGYIRLVAKDLHFCEKHIQQFVPDYLAILAEASQLAIEEADKFKFSYQKRGTETCVLIEGPSEYLDKGSVIITSDDPPDWLLDLNSSEKAGTRKYVPRGTAEKYHLFEHYVIDKLQSDITLHNFHSARFNCKYLTNMTGEARFISKVRNEKIENNDVPVRSAQLSHSIPLFSSLKLETLVRIRKDEYDSFLLYRSALERIVRAQKPDLATSVQKTNEELYEELLKPSLLKLRAEANARNRSKRSSLLKNAAHSAVGLVFGWIPGLSGIVGKSESASVLNSYGEYRNVPPEVRSNEMYFLLKASNEATE